MVIEISGIAFQYSHTIGRGENAGEGFLYPVAIARGQGDRIYVVSRGSDYRPIAKRITICTVGEEYVGEFGKGVLTPQEAETFATLGPLLWPTSIALDKEGKVYVADEWLNWISIFTPDGQFLGRWGKPGDEHGEIDRPAGITFDQDDHLYIVDSLNNRIQVFTKGGKFLAEWGRAGWGDGEFNLPWGIDIDHNGNVYVADWHNERIQKFTADGRFLMKFGSPGTGEGEFNQPTAVAVDKDGIYLRNRLGQRAASSVRPGWQLNCPNEWRCHYI